MSRPVPLGVIWHDIECGNYLEDLPLWRDLAAEAGGPVLDVGAGAGRVALDLAVRGVRRRRARHRRRAAGGADARAPKQFDVTVETVVADARTFDLGADRFGLVAVPMQTLQLLAGRRGARGVLRRRARAR